MFNFSSTICTLSDLCFDLLITSDEHTLSASLRFKGGKSTILGLFACTVDFKMHSKKQQKQLAHPQTLLVKMLKSEHSHYT